MELLFNSYDILLLFIIIIFTIIMSISVTFSAHKISISLRNTGEEKNLNPHRLNAWVCFPLCLYSIFPLFSWDTGFNII